MQNGTELDEQNRTERKQNKYNIIQQNSYISELTLQVVFSYTQLGSRSALALLTLLTHSRISSWHRVIHAAAAGMASDIQAIRDGDGRLDKRGSGSRKVPASGRCGPAH